MICLGGAVTSHDAGMAVPDGFTTFGTWSLIAPLRTWWPDPATRLEHTHRLLGYFVGFSALGLLIGVLASGARRRPGLVALTVGLVVLVIVQATLGILRVDDQSLVLAGIHGVLGQIFLALTVVAAAACGRYWTTRPLRSTSTPESPVKNCRSARWITRILVALLLVQLALGAAVRHSHAALAIPDWPLHYGQVMPPSTPEQLSAAVAAYPRDLPSRYGHLVEGGVYQPWQVHLHFTHRLMGYTLLVIGLFVAVFVWRRYRGGNRGVINNPVVFVGGLLITQVLLGITTVATGDNSNIATLHQTCGAALLASAVWLAVRCHLTPAPDRKIASGASPA